MEKTPGDGDAAREEAIAPGTVLGSYKITRSLGKGAFGAVYEGTHLGLKKRVAVKILHRSIVESGEVVARFLREGEAASRIRHPHVVEVFDLGQYQTRPYIVMEYLDGEDLEAKLERDGKLAPQEIANLILPVLSALTAAHEEGVIHRDLKPANIFLSRLRHGAICPKVVDFGISKLEDDQGGLSLTATTAFLGTPLYMAPEQWRGARLVDARSDQYAIGVIMYQAATGKLPFDADSLMGLMAAILTEPVTVPTDIVPTIPRAFGAIILRAMSCDPTLRYPSLRELALDLLPFSSDAARTSWLAPRNDAPNPASVSEASAPRPSGEIRVTASLPSAPQRDRTVGSVAFGSTSTVAGSAVEVSLARSSVIDPSGVRRPATRSVLWAASAAVLLLSAITGEWVLNRRPVTPSSVRTTRAASAPAVQTPRAPERYRVDLVITPGNAVVALDGAPVGAGTLAREFERDGSPHTVIAMAAGYEPRTITFSQDSPAPESLALVRLRVPTPPVVARIPTTATAAARRVPSHVAAASAVVTAPRQVPPIVTTHQAGAIAPTPINGAPIAE